MKIPITFFGTEDFSLPSLKKLIEADYEIASVITKPDAQRGRGKKVVPPAVKTYAKKHGIEVYQPSSSKELIEYIYDNPTNAAVLVAYGKILPKEVIEKFDKGIINLHPSLLPRYRGPSPIESAILNGDKKTGVSLMKITEKMDAGPIYAQKEIDLSEKETKPVLSEYLAATGAKLLVENLDKITEGLIEPKEQDEEKATYTELIKKSDGDLNWEDSATTNERKVRAFLGWPGSKAKVGKNEIIILSAESLEKEQDVGSLSFIDDYPVVGCREGSLKLIKVKPPGKSAMNGDEYTRGYLKN